MTPLISVIIPTYNNADTIGVALRSILDQTLHDIEVIVVDDTSTDGTREAAEKEAAGDSRVRFFTAPDDLHRYDEKLKRNVNAGWSARNVGLNEARGEYITFQDGDDASLLNRLEIQLSLLKKYNATMITTDSTAFDTASIGTQHNGHIPSTPAMHPKEIVALSKRTKGIIARLFPALNRAIPFRYKRLRVIHRLFFGSLASYPGAGNSPFFKREVIEHVRFRPLKERVWPSFMGRGADRDFLFQVAETFQNSYYFVIPLYLWSRL